MSVSHRAKHPARVCEPDRECRACGKTVATVQFKIVAKNRLSVICDPCDAKHGGFFAWRSKHWLDERECSVCGVRKPASGFYGKRDDCKPCAQARNTQLANARDAARSDVPHEIECSQCTRILETEMFYPQKAGKHGRTAMCKECYSAKAKSFTTEWIAGDDERLECVACKGSFLATAFRKAKRSRGGRETQCLRCARSYACDKQSAYYAANPEKFRERSLSFARTHRDICAARHKDWRKRNPCKQSVISNRRRVVKMNAPGRGVTADEWGAVLEYFDNRCGYCLVQSDSLEMDHVIALTRDGEHSPENVIPACDSCNASKNNKSMLQIFDRRLLVAQRMGV